MGKSTGVLINITQYPRLVSKKRWKIQIFDLIHKTSSLIGTNYIEIEVIGTQGKNLQLELKSNVVRSIETLYILQSIR